MSVHPKAGRIVKFQTTAAPAATPAPAIFVHAVLRVIADDGTLVVETLDGHTLHCDSLEGASTLSGGLAPGDRLLVAMPAAGYTGVVLGRVGRYREIQPEPHITIEASETLTLKCGESSVDLRADGKVMVRGEDLLLRAKGTHRIKAGTVAIN